MELVGSSLGTHLELVGSSLEADWEFIGCSLGTLELECLESCSKCILALSGFRRSLRILSPE